MVIHRPCFTLDDLSACKHYTDLDIIKPLCKLQLGNARRPENEKCLLGMAEALHQPTADRRYPHTTPTNSLSSSFVVEQRCSHDWRDGRTSAILRLIGR
jgi:hypothetical protein